MLVSFIIMYLPFIALISLVLYLPLYFVRKHRGPCSFWRHLATYALIGCGLSLLYLTILWYWPNITFTPEWRFLNLKPFIWLTQTYEMGPAQMMKQLLLNICMFIPFGFLLPVNFARLRKLWKTAGVTLATTLAIETLQYFMGRSADIDDAIMNLAGGLIGYGLFSILNRRFGAKAWWRKAIYVEK